MSIIRCYYIKMKLSYKFFISFLLTSVITIVLMVVIMEFYLHKNFVEFMNKMDMKILNELDYRLRIEYKTEQSWNRLRNNHFIWRELLHSIRHKNKHNKPHPPPSQHHHFRRKPPKGGPFRRFTLFDAQKNRVVGNPAPITQHQLQAIMVEGKIVGWLGIHKRKPRSKPWNIKFLKQQTEIFYVIATSILLITLLLAWWLSRQLLIPIQQLIKGTQALSSRKFKTKIKINSNDELGKLAEDFNSMSQTLERYEIMRQQWLSDISHELRTPLSIMRGEIEAMQDGIREFNNEALNSLHFEVQRMSRLVDDLRQLSLADTETLSLKKEGINPLQILRDTVKLYKTQLAQHNISVEENLQADSILQANADKLRQLYSNILENTLRYVDSPASLKIFSEQTKTQLSINFIDSGSGVPEESIERLFDRLYRVEQSRNRAKGGSGLGLAICKNIVEMHGGTITASNVSSGGLWIKIVFPLK
jgi:two-component system sensor histidine kinase BaeS